MAFQGVDFMEIDALLSEEQLLIRDTVRSFVEDNVLPTIEDNYLKGVFPQELIKPMAELGFLGANLHGYGCAGLDEIAYG